MALTESELNESLNKANVSIAVYEGGRQKLTFKTFAELKTFFDGEVSFWQPHSVGLPEICSHFQKIRTLLSEATSQQTVELARSRIMDAVGQIRLQERPNVYSSTPLAKFLADVESKDKEAAKGAYSYHAGSLQQATINKSSSFLSGIIGAAIFNNPSFVSAGLDAGVQSL